MDAVEEILLGIEPGCFFDSHYVTDQLIENHSDEYLRIAQSINASTENLTLRTHQKIGHQIAKREGTHVERQSAQSYSRNIHGNASTCALWKRTDRT
jgi:hypothetical protein